MHYLKVNYISVIIWVCLYFPFFFNFNCLFENYPRCIFPFSFVPFSFLIIHKAELSDNRYPLHENEKHPLKQPSKQCLAKFKQAYPKYDFQKYELKVKTKIKTVFIFLFL